MCTLNCYVSGHPLVHHKLCPCHTPMAMLSPLLSEVEKWLEWKKSPSAVFLLSDLSVTDPLIAAQSRGPVRSFVCFPVCCFSHQCLLMGFDQWPCVSCDLWLWLLCEMPYIFLFHPVLYPFMSCQLYIIFCLKSLYIFFFNNYNNIQQHYWQTVT